MAEGLKYTRIHHTSHLYSIRNEEVAGRGNQVKYARRNWIRFSQYMLGFGCSVSQGRNGRQGLGVPGDARRRRLRWWRSGHLAHRQARRRRRNWRKKGRPHARTALLQSVRATKKLLLFEIRRKITRPHNRVSP